MRREFGRLAPQVPPQEKPDKIKPYLEVLPGGHADDEEWDSAIAQAHQKAVEIEENEQAEWEAAIKKAHNREANEEAEWERKRAWAHREAENEELRQQSRLRKENREWEAAIKAAHKREEDLETQRLSTQNVRKEIAKLTPFLSPKQREALQMAEQHLETLNDEAARRSYAGDILDWIEVFAQDPNIQLQKVKQRNDEINKLTKLRGTPKSELNEPNPARTVSPSKTKGQKFVEWLKS